MREMPKTYERYKHFKGREYQVLLIAKNEKTMEDMVVYQALYEPYQIYVREAGEFLSEVDKEKYPNALQEERFKLIVNEDKKAETVRPVVNTPAKENSVEKKAGSDEPVRTAVIETVKEEKPEPEYANNGVNPVLMRFLDADDGQAQLNVLNECADKITEEILTPMELSLGMEPSKEAIDERIRNIRNNITTKMKYEIRR